MNSIKLFYNKYNNHIIALIIAFLGTSGVSLYWEVPFFDKWKTSSFLLFLVFFHFIKFGKK